MNRLTKALSEVCVQKMLAEKWLLAPSRRVGQQWLEAVNRNGVAIVNLRVKTLKGLAVDLAAEQMAARGLTLASSPGGTFLVDRIVRRLRTNRLEYLARFDPGGGMTEAVCASITAIRLAGLDNSALDDHLFEVADKGHDLRAILHEYLASLEASQLIDEAELLRMASTRIRDDAASLPDDLVLLVPADFECNRLERELLDTFPVSRRHTLPVDEPATPDESATTDLELLRWLEDPIKAPSPMKDGSVTIRHAIGEVNEVRDVLRRCVSGQMRFDDVELLHTDAETYVPLVYETLCALAREGETLGDDLPVTFAEGIPCRYSRPGRALAIWLAWIEDDYPQPVLVQMLREGLLEVNQAGDEGMSYSWLSALLRGVGIGFRRERYRTQLKDRIAGLQCQIDEPPNIEGDDGELGPRRLASLHRQLQGLQSLDLLCERLFACSPTNPSNDIELLAGAAKFLKTLARAVNQIDRFAVLKLAEDIGEMHQWLSVVDGETHFDARDWLTRLPSESRVLGSGPRPGCLHVSQALSGGHSGRPYTFIVGMDDSRFPGVGLQDPLLLDSERRKLSPELVTAAERLKQRQRDLIRLLARLRGKLMLSFAARSVDDDREMFPSGPVMAAYRLISGKRDGEQSDLFAWLAQQSPPASFAPYDPAEGLSPAEWWLWRLCGATSVRDPVALVLTHFPHLARGRRAAAERRRREFTEYDGCVEQAGHDLDPTQSDHDVLSANRLQKIGTCPLKYFFEYGLGIVPPDELEVDSTIWLDSLTSGSLLHGLFERFMRELLVAGLIPSYERDKARLRELLAAEIARYREIYPVPSESVFQQQQARLDQTAMTFLREEERYCTREGSRPVYLEASLGMATEEHSTPVDTLDPIPIDLSGQRQVRLRGRIDRIDLIGSGAVKTFAIWDYKTGSTWGYDRAKPFQQGRILQPYLYMTMVTHRLRATVDPNAVATYFGFFFPGIKARGERMTWTRDSLAPGREILERLVQIVSSGAFLATNNADDCKYCDYRGICGDVDSPPAR
jgi:ATP-dependent helicase/nuclease subunit B